MEIAVIRKRGRYFVNLIVNHKAYTLDKHFLKEVDAMAYGNRVIFDIKSDGQIDSFLTTLEEMTKTDLILQWETTKLLVDKDMHEAGKKQDANNYAIQSELSRAISLFIGDLKKLDLVCVPKFG